MQFSTISLSFYDLLQIFRNCLGNLFFLFFLFLAKCSSRERPYRNGWPCHIFRLYLLDKFCTAPRRRNVSLGCPAVPLSPQPCLPAFSFALCYPVVLVSFGLVVCLAISMEAPALHVINNIISRKGGVRRQLRLRLRLQLQLRRALPAAAAFLLFYSPNVIAKCACLVHIFIVAIVFWAFLLLCAFSCSSNVPLRQCERGEVQRESWDGEGGTVYWSGLEK